MKKIICKDREGREGKLMCMNPTFPSQFELVIILFILLMSNVKTVIKLKYV